MGGSGEERREEKVTELCYQYAELRMYSVTMCATSLTGVPSQLLRQDIVHGTDGTSPHVLRFGTQHCQTAIFSSYLIKWSIGEVCGNGGREGGGPNEENISCHLVDCHRSHTSQMKTSNPLRQQVQRQYTHLVMTKMFSWCLERTILYPLCLQPLRAHSVCLHQTHYTLSHGTGTTRLVPVSSR